MTTAIIATIIGFIGLIWSADRFVAGAAGLAKGIGMTPIMIGLTIVALGTSAPEIIVAISASMEDASELAVGNALGSNLANIGLVLGITALVCPIPIAHALLKREFPILIAATLGAGILLYDNELGFWDGIMFLTGLAIIFYYIVNSKSHQVDAAHEADIENIPEIPTNKAWQLFIIGLVLLIVSSKILVMGAKDIALAMGVSELIVGLTVVAIGTSLPELAATIASALKGHHDIAIGNIVGSNLFNLLAVMAMPALINPPKLDEQVFQRDYVAMTAITLLLAAIVLGHTLWQKHKTVDHHTTQLDCACTMGRSEGVVLLAAYIFYCYILF